MKVEFELSLKDCQAIAHEVVEILKPLLKTNGKEKADGVVFDVSSLAEYLKVDKSWVYKQVQFKTIPHYRIGKYVRFKKEDIDEWIEQQKLKPVPLI